MTVFDSNLLDDALSIIGTQEVAYYQWIGSVTNDIGVDVDAYNPPENLVGSVQAVPQNMYEMLGLNFQKQYIYFFCSKALIDLERDVSGDLIQYGDSIYKVESLTDWFMMDGWVQALAVKTDKEVPEPGTFIVDPSIVYIVEP